MSVELFKMVCSCAYKVLAHWNESPDGHVSPLGHFCLISSHCYCSVMLCVGSGKVYSLWFDPTRLDSTKYYTQGEHANYYTTDTIGTAKYVMCTNDLQSY